MADINENLDYIRQSIELEIDNQNPDEVTGKLTALCNLTGLSSQMLADAELEYSAKILSIMEGGNAEYHKLSATDKRNMQQGLAAMERHNVTYADRLNKALVHSIDGLRSILSALKEEKRNVNNMSA